MSYLNSLLAFKKEKKLTHSDLELVIRVVKKDPVQGLIETNEIKNFTPLIHSFLDFCSLSLPAIKNTINYDEEKIKSIVDLNPDNLNKPLSLIKIEFSMLYPSIILNGYDRIYYYSNNGKVYDVKDIYLEAYQYLFDTNNEFIRNFSKRLLAYLPGELSSTKNKDYLNTNFRYREGEFSGQLTLTKSVIFSSNSINHLNNVLNYIHKQVIDIFRDNYVMFDTDCIYVKNIFGVKENLTNFLNSVQNIGYNISYKIIEPKEPTEKYIILGKKKYLKFSIANRTLLETKSIK